MQSVMTIEHRVNDIQYKHSIHQIMINSFITKIKYGQVIKAASVYCVIMCGSRTELLSISQGGSRIFLIRGGGGKLVGVTTAEYALRTM